MRERALLHQTEATRTYPCRACGGELEFHIGEQQLVCPHCGSTQEIVEDGTATVDEQDFAAAIAAIRSGALERSSTALADEHEVVCQNCGGHTTFTGTLTATRCPYCATPILRDDIHDAPSRLAVDGVVPFRVDESAAHGAVKHWASKRWFAPNEFKKYNRAAQFSSVYMAFFTYDAQTTTHYTGQRGVTHTRTVGSGENRRTETYTVWYPAAGTVHNAFDDIVVHANAGLNEKHIDRLEPWPTQQAEPYSAEYVAGHLCRTYDRDVEQCFGDARQTIDKEVTRTIRGDIGGNQQRIHSRDTSYQLLTYKHLLLPLWLLTVFFQNQAYQVMVNGVTGEVQGDRPWSKVKIALAVVAVLLVVAAVAVLWAMNGGS